MAEELTRSHPLAQPTPSHAVLLDQAAGPFLTMAFLMLVTLRSTSDVKIWKQFEFSILLADFAVFYSFWRALGGQGRLAVAELRWEEWGTLGITGFVTAVRIAFLAELGFSKKIGVTDGKKK